MSQGTVLVANRGEIAVRILRTARKIGLEVVLVYAEDDGAWIRSDYGCVAHALTGSGPAADLDREQLVRAAVEHRADMVHPGCGFLNEDHAFADLLTAAGVSFVGPTSEQLRLLGDKTRARALARDGAVPVLPGTDGPTTLDEAAVSRGAPRRRRDDYDQVGRRRRRPRDQGRQEPAGAAGQFQPLPARGIPVVW